MSLASLQEKVMCPVARWLPNFTIHAFYLPSYLYKDGERPEDPDEDLCIGPIDMIDPSGMCFELNRGKKHVVDDRSVAVFQLLFREGNYIFYKHGNQKFSDVVLPFKISLVEILDHPEGDPTMQDIRLLDGRGIFPDECQSGTWKHPYHDDDEIGGVKAFCISVDVLRQPGTHAEWQVRRARRHLRLEDGEDFDLSRFDKEKEQKEIEEAASKFLLKRGAAGNPMDSMMFMLSGFNLGQGVAESGKQRCMNCEIEERNLGPGGKLLRCSKCGNAVYCGAACQKEDWDMHKNVCVESDLVKKNKKGGGGRGRRKHRDLTSGRKKKT